MCNIQYVDGPRGVPDPPPPDLNRDPPSTCMCHQEGVYKLQKKRKENVSDSGKNLHLSKT